MDRVRFGRALGYGARHAAKTLLQAADAARAPASAPSRAASPVKPPAASPAPSPVRPSMAPSAREVKHLGRSLWSPLARFSSVVWLQVTGLLFAFMAIFLLQGVWQQRAALHLPPDSHPAERFYLLCAASLAFAYFSLSNFVRASRRNRR